MSRFISLIDTLPGPMVPSARVPDRGRADDVESSARLIEAVVQASDLERIRAGFDKAGIANASLVGCSTFAGESGPVVSYRGAKMRLDGSPRFLVRVCVAPSQVAMVADILQGNGRNAITPDVVVHDVTRLRAKC